MCILHLSLIPHREVQMRLSAAVTVIVTLTLATLAHGATTQGVLPGSETWSGAITIVGDVTVPVGVTLTIAPGAVISFAGTDSMGSGTDTSRPELIVEGTLSASGSAAQPVELKNQTGTWYGVRLESGSSATMNHVQISGARYGIYGNASFTFKNGTISGTSDYAMYVNAGSPEIAYNQFLANQKVERSTAAACSPPGPSPAPSSTRSRPWPGRSPPTPRSPSPPATSPP